MLPRRTSWTVRFNRVSARTLGTTPTLTTPRRSRMPNTGTLPAAPRPRRPLRRPPKYDSSASTSPRSSNSPSTVVATTARRKTWKARSTVAGAVGRRDQCLPAAACRPSPAESPRFRQIASEASAWFMV